MAREELSESEIRISLPRGKEIFVPLRIAKILELLEKSGFEAFLVGGCVRDAMLGDKPHDYDVCTNALTHETKEIFKDFRIIETGLKHGTVTVLSEGQPVEITTYRVDGEYKDHRRPEQVLFTRDIFEDLKRRDFTVNAMAVSLDGTFCQADGGDNDLSRKIIRCVGDAEKRFEEDALRILRAMRFAARLDFEIEEKTFEAMLAKKELLKFVSAERIFSELTGLLTVKDGATAAKVLNRCKDIIGLVIAELVPTFNCDQESRHHIYNVWEHILKSIENSGTNNDPVLRWALFLHDICKPDCKYVGADGRGHFPMHDVKGAEAAARILKRLKAPNEFTENVFTLIKNHDFRCKPSEKNALKILARCGGEELAFKLCKMMECDILAQSDFEREQKLSMVKGLRDFTDKVLLEEKCFKIKDLKINGNILFDLGVPKGPEMKKILNSLLDAVMDGAIENNEDALKAYALNKIIK